MADTNIRFKIGSSFEGEGFQAATKAIQENRKEIRGSVRGLGELTKAFESLSPTAAESIGIVKQFGAAFVTGGIVGGTIQLAIQGISKAVEFGVEMYNKAKEAVAKYAAEFRDNLLAYISDGAERLDALSKNMERVTQQAKDMAAAMNIATDSKVQNEVYRVNVEKLQQITDDMTTATRGVLEAQANQKIAIIKATAAVEKTGAALDAASAAYDSACEVQKTAAKNAQDAEIRLNVARQDLTMSQEDLEKIIKAAADAQAALNNANNAVTQAQLNLERASNAETAAHQQLEVTTLEQAQKVKDAQAALEKEKEAQAKADEKLKEAKEKEAKERDEFSDYVQNLKIKMEEEIEERKGLSASTKKLTKAQEDAAGALDELYGDEGGKGKGGGDPSKVKNVKVTNPGDIGTSVNTKIDMAGVQDEIKKPKGLDNETFERIKKGQASIADWRRFDRFTERENRDEQSSKHRIGGDAVKFLQNAEKPTSWLSERDKKFNEDFKTRVLPQLPKDVAKQLLGDASKKLLCKESMKEIFKDKNIIDAWLGKLGLK